MDAKKSNEMIDKIDKVLKRREQFRRLEEYVGGRPKIVNPPKMKGMRKDEYAIEFEVFNLLKIDADLFTYETPLGMVINEFKRLSSMENDLFTYELGVVEDFYFPCVEKQLDNLENGDLDVYEQKVCYDECEKIYAEAIIFTNKRLVRLIDVTMEQWLDMKYGDHKTMDKIVKDGVIAT
ncbi:hypothetical protein Tco_1073073 [Tanacetum coccineum]